MIDVSYFKDLENVKSKSMEVYFTHKNSTIFVHSVKSILKKEIAKIEKQIDVYIEELS